jgi:quercetin dioxygenase-like cupin family protein
MRDLTAGDPIERLQRAMSALPQAILPPTEHYFSNGMYCRKMMLPAGTLIVGKRHKHEHFFILCSGVMELVNEDGRQRIIAGTVICAQPGTKRALYCVTACIGMNVHRTDKTNLDEIEAELIEPDDAALFDARNELKPEVIECS